MGVVGEWILGALAVYGLYSLLCRLELWLTRPVLPQERLCLLVRPESAEDCECLLRGAVLRAKRLGESGCCEVLCVPPAGGEEGQRICRCLAREYPCIRLLEEEPGQEQG